MSSLLGDNAKVFVQTKGDIVRERIETAIMDGRFKPGDRIVVDAIARELGVSKIPVRDALGKLESVGLIEQIQHSGYRVSSLSLHEMRGVYLLRAEIEELTAGLAATMIDDVALESLSAINRKMIDLVKREETQALSSLNREFHMAIARATTYEILAEVTDDALRKVHQYRSVVVRSVKDWRDSVVEHEKIIAALRAHDAEAARAAARAHASNQLQVEKRAEHG
jgi:DNA-binding GntR family transcriptional regulator